MLRRVGRSAKGSGRGHRRNRADAGATSNVAAARGLAPSRIDPAQRDAGLTVSTSARQGEKRKHDRHGAARNERNISASTERMLNVQTAERVQPWPATYTTA